MRVKVTFEDGTSVILTVQSDVLLCDFVRQARQAAGTMSPVALVDFLRGEV